MGVFGHLIRDLLRFLHCAIDGTLGLIFQILDGALCPLSRVGGAISGLFGFAGRVIDTCLHFAGEVRHDHLLLSDSQASKTDAR
jgi:hypothetical protein